MLWNPWRECRRLREELAKVRAENAVLLNVSREAEQRNRVLFHAYTIAVQKVVFLTARCGLTPEMVQVDDYGEVRLGLPPDVETRGTA